MGFSFLFLFGISCTEVVRVGGLFARSGVLFAREVRVFFYRCESIDAWQVR